MKKLLLFIILLAPLFVKGEDDKKEKKISVKLSGFIKTDFFLDTRQTVNAREGHFLLFPAQEILDANGDDIYKKSSTNFLAVQSRLSVKVTGPDAFGAKTSGLVEGDFFGQANDNINLFRLRHAFVKLNWETTELLFGQYWNPLFVTDCFPGTVSFNTGAPIQPFARNPQVRLTQKMGSFKLIAAALSQRDYTSRGPNGTSSEYLRNSSIPDMHLQLHYGTKSESGTQFVTGVGMEYKTIVPRLSNVDGTRKVDESCNSLSFQAFAKLKTKPITIKAEAVLGENLADVLSISGFAVKNDDDPTNQTYTPLRNTAVWTDIHTNGGKIQGGLFVGYTKNRGTKDVLSNAGNAVYGLGTNIDNLYRIAPRLIVNSGKTRFAAEIEHTAAAYGTGTRDNRALYTTTNRVSNTRFLFAVYYFF